MAVDVARAAMR
jgi:GTPase